MTGVLTTNDTRQMRIPTKADRYSDPKRTLIRAKRTVAGAKRRCEGSNKGVSDMKQANQGQK